MDRAGKKACPVFNPRFFFRQWIYVSLNASGGGKKPSTGRMVILFSCPAEGENPFQAGIEKSRLSVPRSLSVRRRKAIEISEFIGFFRLAGQLKMYH